MNAKFHRALPGALLSFLLFVLFIALFPQPSSADEPIWMILISDTHLGFKKSNEAFQAFLKEVPLLPFKVSMIINNGDIAEVGSPPLFDAYMQGVKSLSLDSWNVIGNHDTRWAPTGKDLFAQSIGPPYFSKDFAGIHWLFLDSTLEHQTQGHIDQSEITWIKKDLDAIPPDEPILVFSHHPLKWRGISIDNGLDVLNVLDSYPVAALFNGHGHKVKEFHFRGIPFIENDALFNGHYLILEKSGETLRLSIKTLGEPEPKPWIEINLHPHPSPARIVAPPLNGGVKKKLGLRVKLEPTLRATVQLDQNPPATVPSQTSDFQQTLEPGGLGWHTLRVSSPEAPWGEDETRFFVPGDLTALSLGEIYAGLVTNGRFVFAGTLDGTLFAVDPQGLIEWKKKLDGGILAAPFTTDKIIYVGTRAGNFYALRTKDGALVWKIKLDFPFPAPPLMSGSTVYVVAGDKNLHALDAGTGKEKWSRELGSFSEMQPLERDGIIYLGAWGHSFYAVDARSGEIRWKKNIGKAIYYSPSVARPVLMHGILYLAAKDHQAYALDEKTGKSKWARPLEGGFTSPVLAGGQLIIPETGGTLVSVNPSTGKSIWTQKFPTSFYNASPLVAGDNLFLIGIDGKYFKFNLKTHQVETELHVARGWNFSSPVILAGKIWIGSLDGHLYAVPLKP